MKPKVLLAVLCAIAVLFPCTVCPAEETLMTREAAVALTEEAWNNYAEKAAADETRLVEILPVMESDDGWFVCEMTRGDKTMLCFVSVKGEPDENGLYPLYIALHGGGGGEDAREANNSQWMTMCDYYLDTVDRGIYVACRAIEDTWNCHFTDEAYAFYDRLINNMVLLCGADPNRVYLLGFSAGGDGVYAISPRMADRFAAVNMTSGHPNGVSMLNMANLPIAIQVGVLDYYDMGVERNLRGAEMENTLNGFRKYFGFGYPHRVWVHVPEGHFCPDNVRGENEVLADPGRFALRADAEEWMEDFLSLPAVSGMPVSDLSYADDNPVLDRQVRELLEKDKGMTIAKENTCAVDYVSGFTRDPAPARLVWDLSTRASLRDVDSFYWLSADRSVDRGVITAAYDKTANSVTLTTEGVNGDFAVLINPRLIDVSRPVTFITESGSATLTVKPSADIAAKSVAMTGDPFLSWVAEIGYGEILSAIK